ncbi:MAG TPA: hypothetical protein VKD67_07300 [Acidimicrobiales bacterium]|nr:hypothetical protein [Acidimicrobiales bacterium]
MLAYLFWHTPRDDDAARYCAGLAAFHRALAADPPAGFARSWTVRVSPVDWLPASDAHYVDWYVVDDFAALGPLNEAAVSGPRQAPHDAVASLARTGTGGIVAQLGGGAIVPVLPPPGHDSVLAMVDKPADMTYHDFTSALVAAAPDASCWMRQMTLGPGPEFIVLGGPDAPMLPWPTFRLPGAIVAM